jgi:uncharacterized protein
MVGEELNSSHVTERGLLGDRTYAVVYQKTGKVAGAKNPGKWGRLLVFRSVFVDPQQAAGNIPPPPVRITFPDGTYMFSDQHDDDDVDYNLSKVFGRDVKLLGASSM